MPQTDARQGGGEVLAYPASPQKFTTQDFAAALTRIGLGHLSPGLDRFARWDRDLTGPEQQAIAFARVLLHKPRWVFIDEAIDSLSPAARKAVFDIFTHELVTAAVVNITGSQANGAFFTRILHLTKKPQGEHLALAPHLLRTPAKGIPGAFGAASNEPPVFGRKSG